jgi:hypothetical protein
MTKTLSMGYTDTPVEGVTALTFPRAILNFKEDWRVKSNNNGKEIILTNLKAPVDRPETIRIARSEVTNVFSGSPVEPTIYTSSKKGASLLIQHISVPTATDSTDSSFRVDEPIKIHVVAQARNSEFITAQVLIDHLGRLISALYDSGVDNTSRLDALLRGSLVPSEL